MIHAPEGAGAIWRGAHRLPHQSQMIGRDCFAETLAREPNLVARMIAFRVDPKQEGGPVRGPYRILVQENAGTPCTAFVRWQEMRAWLRAYGLRLQVVGVPQNRHTVRMFRIVRAEPMQRLSRPLSMKEDPHMTDDRELRTLARRMEERGASVTFYRDPEGRIDRLSITCAPGIGPHAMSPLSAAERMREWLARPVVGLVKTRSVMRMTKARALEIQAGQVEHYAAIYGPHVRDLVAAATTADELPDGEHDVVTINRHIPRGGAIEWLIPEKRAAEEAHQARIRALD